MVKVKTYNIIWSDMAKVHLKEIYRYIKKDSEQSAKKVRTEILLSTRLLSTGKELFKADEFKQNNKETTGRI